MGVIYSIKLKKRVSIVHETLIMLEEMKVLLQYLNIPVYEMLMQISNKDYLRDLDFIAECCRQMSAGTDFPMAWKDALKSTDQLYKTEEIEKLLQLGENLGTSNAENQLKFLNLQTTCFETFLKTAEDKNKKYSTTAITLSTLTGCMIFILIL